MGNYPGPIAVQMHDGSWKAAFWDRWYQDYVIKVWWRRCTKEEIEEDLRAGRIIPNDPRDGAGK